MASHRLIQWIGKSYGLDVCEGIYDLLNTYYFVDGHSLNDKPRLAEAVANEMPRLLLLQKHQHQQQDHHNTTTAITMPTTPPAPSADEILAFLNGNEGRNEIEQAFHILQNDLGIHSIPTFIIEGLTVINGAAHSTTLINIFRNIERRGYLQGNAIFAQVLGISSEIIQRGSHYSSSSSASLSSSSSKASLTSSTM